MITAGAWAACGWACVQQLLNLREKSGMGPFTSVKRTLDDQMTYKTSVLIMIDCLGLQILLRDVMSKWQSPETGVVKSIRDFDLTSRKANQSKILT